MLAIGLAPASSRATDLLFTSNKAELDGAEGVRISLGTKTIGSFTSVPCSAAVNLVDWSPNGSSWGVACNRAFSATNDFIWVSISSNDPVDCSATSDECMGAARYDVSSGALNYYFSSAWNEPNAVIPDLVANQPNIIALDKRDSSDGTASVEEWVVSTSSTFNEDQYDHLSQVEWVGNNNLFAYTITKTLVSGAGCEETRSAFTATKGKVALGKFGAPGELDIEPIERPSGFGSEWYTKPEGVTVAAIRPSASASCTAGSTHVIYVTDYCLSQVHVFTTDDTVSSPILTFETVFDLNASSSSSNECHPSSIRYHIGSDDTYILCQDNGRNTIIRLDTGTDQCDPAWDEEETLQYQESGTNPTCSVTPSLTDCGFPNDNCQPHDIAYDRFSAPGWLFVNISATNPGGNPDGQVLAIKDSSLSDQFLLYRDHSGEYDPVELDLLPSAPPE